MDQNSTLQEIVNVIINTLSPDRIILLGYIDKEEKSFSILNGSYSELSDFVDLNLLIISDNGCSNRQRYQDIIEQRCKSFTKLTSLILTRAEVQNLIVCKNRLVLMALQFGKILYQKWEPAPHILKSICEAEIKQEDEVELASWYQRSHLFYQMANEQYNVGNYGMAAFCIHQSIEQILILLIISACGYRMGLHNPDRLLRMLRFHINAAADVFPTETTQEKERMCLLKKVYINYRYKNNLSVSGEDIRYYFKELGKLHTLADRIITV